MELISKRLILRPWLDSDAPALYNLARNPKVGPAAGWPAHESVEQSLDILCNILRGPEQYAITLRDTGELIGAIGLKTREDCPYLPSDNDYSVGYWIGEEHWGHGYAPEALERLIEHARVDLKAHTIWADHFICNEKSHRVMEKCELLPVRTDISDAVGPDGSRETLIMRRDLR